MKALVQNRYGSADLLHLEDIEEPEVGADEVLVRVQAAGIDAGVWHLMAGRPYLLRLFGFGLRAPRLRVRGRDVAGTVAAVGDRVTRFRVGDAVFGTSLSGSFAEYTRVPADRLAQKPANLGFVEAAAVPVSACAALHALRDARKVQAGQRVLVIGAGGGVGTFAVQLATAFGATVTGVCSTGKVDLVRSLGAERVIDYTREDFADGRNTWDLILDIAGNPTLSRLRRALTPTGTLVIVGGEGGGAVLGGIDRQLRALLLSGFVKQTLRGVVSAEGADDLETLGKLLEAGTIRPVIDRTFSLGEAADGIRYQHAGQASGKVVVTVP